MKRNVTVSIYKVPVQLYKIFITTNSGAYEDLYVRIKGEGKK